MTKQPVRGFVVSEHKGLWRMRLSRGRVFRMVGTLLLGCVLMIAGGVLLDRQILSDKTVWGIGLFTLAGVATGILLSGLAIWFWLSRNDELSIELQKTALRIGEREIAGPGSVASVLVRRPSSLSEDEDHYFIVVQLKNGDVRSIPAPSFSAIGNQAETVAVAQEMADRLKANLVLDY